MTTADLQPPDRSRIPKVGETAPDFELLNCAGESRHLEALVNQRPLILLFYRGYW